MIRQYYPGIDSKWLCSSYAPHRLPQRFNMSDQQIAAALQQGDSKKYDPPSIFARV